MAPWGEEGVASALGTTPDKLDAETRREAGSAKLSFQRLTAQERDAVVLGVLQKLDANQFPKTGKDRHGVWEMAWAERAGKFKDASYSLEGLLPAYMNASEIVRVEQDFARAQPEFETTFSGLFRRWLFRTYLGGASRVLEFGCGSGINLTMLAELFPEKDLVGLDWADSAVDLVNLVSRKHGLRLKGRRFDFFEPDQGLDVGPDAAVVTMCALEQVGANHGALLEFLLQKRPQVCLHMEPICELYDEKNLVDYLAIRYHRQRNYLDGFLTRLRQLESEGRLRIDRVHRPRVGNLYHEGYSYVVWRPA